MVLRGIAVALATACIGMGMASTATAAPPDCTGRGVPVSKISVQLWTFAEYIGFGTDQATIDRTEEVFRRLSEMGYRNVEPFTLSGMSAADYRALLDKYGLKASARHVDVGTPENPTDFDQILADNKVLGIKFFGSGATPIFPLLYHSEAEWVRYAQYVKDMGAGPFPGPITIDGEGIIDFPSIFAASKGPVRYYVVEHDPRFGDPTFDPFEAAEKGFNYLACVRY